MAGVGVGECRALVELLYTGVAPLSTDVTRILELCGVLGMELEGLCVTNRGTGVGEVRLDMSMDKRNNLSNMQDRVSDNDSVDSVHPRFVKTQGSKPRSFSQDQTPSVRVSGSLSKVVSELPSKIVSESPSKIVSGSHNRTLSGTLDKVVSSIVTPPSSKESEMSPSHKVPSPLASSCIKTYSKRRMRMSQDALAETLKSFPLKKLPIKTPDIPDTILPEITRSNSFVGSESITSISQSTAGITRLQTDTAGLGYTEVSRNSTPAVLQYLHSPQVMLPDNVLTEVMGMLPDAIKQEVEDVEDISCDVGNGVGDIADISDLPIGAEITYGEGAEDIQDLRDMMDPLRNTPTPPYPQLEGRGDDDSPNSPPVTSYLSMDNARNYVCNNCDQGFTFVRSFNWHSKRCQETLAVKQEDKKKVSEVSRDNLVKLENVEVKIEKILTKQCAICKKSVNGLKSHLSLVHFKTKIISDYCSNPRQCKICKNPFKSLHGLILHIGVHHNMVKRYLKEHGKNKKGKRIILEKTTPEVVEGKKRPDVVDGKKRPDVVDGKKRPDVVEGKKKPDVVKRQLSGERENVRISVVAEAKEKMRNRLVYREKQQVKSKTLSASKVKDSSRIVTGERGHVKSITPLSLERHKVKRQDLTKPTGLVKSKTVTREIVGVKSKLESDKNHLNSRLITVYGDKVKKVVSAGRKVSCGECVKCLLPDCGACIHCSDKPQFGGRGVLHNRICVKKVCRNKVWSELIVAPNLVKGIQIKR
eukprot:GFUD01068679.1.p1 GENE.GFUD01068679.1~~GFUD01068679.1.p1  ORF type:complete len:811 (+),score=240.73 GFUD01068679.1:166-2433(+)